MTLRQTWTVAFAVVLSFAAGAVQFADSGNFPAVTRAALAGLLAAAVLILAASVLPTADWSGLIVGGCFVSAGALSWTFTAHPELVWALLGVEILIFGIWAWPWWSRLRPAVRIGAVWLGTAYWLLGIAGTLLATHWRIAAERLGYLGVFGLAALAVSARSRLRDLSAGIAAAFLLALGVILLAGSGNLFEDSHVVPPNEWGLGLEYRFWGGEYLLYQPNSLAALAALVAIRFGLDPAYAVWQRLAVTGLAGFIGYVTHSRTGWVIMTVAGLAHAGLLWWTRRRTESDWWVSALPRYGAGRRTALAATVPLLVSGLVLAAWLVPGQEQVDTAARPGVLQARYSDGGVTSGRLDTWRQVITEWRQAGTVEKLLGDTATTRAVVKRASSGENVQLTTDNAVIGALRRGGVLGVAGFLVGLALLIWHTFRRRRTPAWFVVAVVASLAPVATSDALLGGTGGTVWVLLLAGEAWLIFGTRHPAHSPRMLSNQPS